MARLITKSDIVVQIMPCPQGMVAVFQDGVERVWGVALLDSGRIAPFVILANGEHHFPTNDETFIEFRFATTNTGEATNGS